MFKNIFSVALITLILTNAAAAQPLEFVVKKGQEIDVYTHSFFNGTCKKTKKAHFKVPKSTKLGSMRVVQAPIEIRKVNQDELKHCIGKSVMGAIAKYKAGSVAGQEVISISRKRDSGPYAPITLKITVR